MKNNHYLTSALVLSVAMLAGCSSGSSSSDDEVVDEMQSGTEPTADISDAEDDQSVANGFDRELIGTWVECDDNGRTEFVFSVDSYTLTFGDGNCDRFASAFGTLEGEGSYSLNGTLMTESGQTAYIMEFTVEGAHISAIPTTPETPQFQLVFISEEDQLFLSRTTEDFDALGSANASLNFLFPYNRN